MLLVYDCKTLPVSLVCFAYMKILQLCAIHVVTWTVRRGCCLFQHCVIGPNLVRHGSHTYSSAQGEAGTGNVVEAVRHTRAVMGAIRQLQTMDDDELYVYAKELRAPIELVRKTKHLGRLPVVNFAAGGVFPGPSMPQAYITRLLHQCISQSDFLGAIGRRCMRMSMCRCGAECHNLPC